MAPLSEGGHPVVLARRDRRLFDVVAQGGWISSEIDSDDRSLRLAATRSATSSRDDLGCHPR